MGGTKIAICRSYASRLSGQRLRTSTTIDKRYSETMLSLKERKAKIFGNHALLVTPLLPDGRIDEQSTRSLVNFVVENGVHGILALGSTGEVFCLTDEERRVFAEIVVDEVRGRVPVGIGVNESSADASAQFAQHAERTGEDYIFTTGQYYHPHASDEIYRHIRHIGRSTSLPLMVYDGGAGIELSLPPLKRLVDDIPTLHCAKLFLPYPGKIAEYETATEGKLQAWAGHDQLNFLMLCYRATGMTSAASCVLAREQSQIFDLVQQGSLEKARRIFYETVCPLNSVAFANVLQYPQCYKRALRWMGVIEHDTCKVAMEPLDEVRTSELKGVLHCIGVLH